MPKSIRTAATPAGGLEQTQMRVTAYRRCPRLVRYLADIRAEPPDWWCRPVPSFGDPAARILAVGLAPGRAGSNRTGRMFTGDGSGRFLYPVLHEVGLAGQPVAERIDDGLTPRDLYIPGVGRCAPPQNKPLPDELARCSPFLAEELARLTQLRVIVSLGKIAHDRVLRLLGLRPAVYPFHHGAVYEIVAETSLPGRHFTLIATYHPSRQNTQTRRLTRPMFLAIFREAVRLAGIPRSVL